MVVTAWFGLSCDGSICPACDLPGVDEFHSFTLVPVTGNQSRGQGSQHEFSFSFHDARVDGSSIRELQFANTESTAAPPPGTAAAEPPPARNRSAQQFSGPALPAIDGVPPGDLTAPGAAAPYRDSSGLGPAGATSTAPPTCPTHGAGLRPGHARRSIRGRAPGGGDGAADTPGAWSAESRLRRTMSS